MTAHFRPPGQPRSQDALSRWFTEGMSLPFVWGERDCATWACDWIRAQKGIDPAGPIRGLWHDEASCEAFLRAYGGLGAVALAMADRAGLRLTDAPQRGDVGLLVLPILAGGKSLPLIAICAGPGIRWPMWAWKTTDGVTTKALPVAMAWRVGL